MKADVVPPGGETEIKAVLKTAGKQGNLKKNITVVSNDPNQKNLVLEMRGVVVVDVMAEPRSLSFQQIGKGEAAERELKLTVSEPDRVKVTGVSIADARFRLEKISGDLATESTWRVSFPGSDQLGAANTAVDVAYTAAGAAQSTQIPVRLSVVGDLVYPKTLRFSKSQEGAFSTRNLTLRSRSGKAVEIRKIEDPDGLLKVEIPTPKGERAEAKLSVLDPSKDYSDSASHTLRVHTGDAEEPILEITYVVGVRSKPSKGAPFLGKNGLNLDIIKSKRR